MKVLIVCNNAYLRGNGICTAVRSLFGRLKGAGIDVRLMACGNPDPQGEQPDYSLKHFKIPIFEPIIHANGFTFAKVDRKIIAEAIAWADVVHVSEAFPLEAATVRIAKRAGTPCVGSFHMFSQNILANIGLRRAYLLNAALTWWWRKTVYDYCTHIHCPTEPVRVHLVASGYKAHLVMVSNGIGLSAEPVITTEPQQNPVILLCTGRFSHEKSQEVLLEAMKYSKYADRIQLHFAGRGPLEARYKRLSNRLVRRNILTYAPIFGFYSAEDLEALARRAYLYIHCAWVEVEGLSCVEALKEGAVPVIAKGPYTAAWRFALDDRSIFPVFDAKTLAIKIDWWIEHPEERARMGQEYAGSIRKYDIADSVDQMILMYQESINSGSLFLSENQDILNREIKDS